MNAMSRSQRSKDALFHGLAEVGRALASGPRLALMDLLSQGERSVDELASSSGLSVANVGFLIHTGLKTLRERLTEPRSDRDA